MGLYSALSGGEVVAATEPQIGGARFRTRVPKLGFAVVLLVFGALLFPLAREAAADPTFTEFSSGLPSGADPADITQGPDGNLWFTDYASDAIGRITTSGTITEFPVTGTPLFITKGSDGNLWFTVANGGGETGAIGRITTSGDVTEFSDGLNSLSSPFHITSGPDGNVWFTDNGDTNAVGRITPDGDITEFSVEGTPYGITTGSDGNLWFVTQGWGTDVNHIGRITPAGTRTYFADGLQDSPALGSITAGPDGNLWFTDEGEETAIGRVTTQGKITEFPGDLSYSNCPNDIVSGADGNLWFTDDCSGAVGEVTPAGATIRLFSSGLNENSYPENLTPGPDGNIWFTDEGDTAAIGRAELPVPPDQAQARQFEPVLRFDSSEEWRPLNVASFFAEGDQQICDTGQDPQCDASPMESSSDLFNHNDSTAYVKVYPGNYEGAGDEANYVSPYPECTSNGLRDCDSGPRSAIYYGTNDPSVETSYHFIDYWFFYRANYFAGDVDFHEGDWEGVTIAPSSNGDTFDYAAFSQHGTWATYLRSVLRCEDTPASDIPAAGTCGDTSGRIDVMVANGSHANYTTPCSGSVPPVVM